jgi:hypothetical protein
MNINLNITPGAAALVRDHLVCSHPAGFETDYEHNYLRYFSKASKAVL